MPPKHLLKYIREIPTNVDPWLALTQISGVCMVVVAGMYHFSLYTDLSLSDCKAHVGCLSLHGLLMTYGFLFFQGEALISKRLYQVNRFEKRISTAIVHIFNGICTIILAIIALVAALNHKDDNEQNDAYTFHSWFGIGIIVLFVAQTILGVVNAGCYSPEQEHFYNVRLHKWIGVWLFEICTIQAISGHVAMAMDPLQRTQYYNQDTFTRQAVLLNVTAIMILFYSTSVNFFVVESRWHKRLTKDE